MEPLTLKSAIEELKRMFPDRHVSLAQEINFFTNHEEPDLHFRAYVAGIEPPSITGKSLETVMAAWRARYLDRIDSRSIEERTVN